MLSDGRHYWRVRAINFLNIPGKWSTYRYFTVDTLAPSVPAMSTPAGSVVVHTTTPKLVVYTVSGAKYYRFQVDDMNDFYSPLVDVTKTLNYYTVQSSLALPYGAMYWRVQTIDAAGNASAWSSPKSFIVSP
jgi:predicted phage tail protein